MQGRHKPYVIDRKPVFNTGKMPQHLIFKAGEKATFYFYLKLVLLELIKFPCQTSHEQSTGKVTVSFSLLSEANIYSSVRTST